MRITRRFGRVLEFDRNGPPWSGTKEQQSAIREWVKTYASYGSRLDQVLYALDRDINLVSQSFIPITFIDGGSMAVPAHIYLSQQLSATAAAAVFPHELGHIVGWRLFNPGVRSEAWAAEFAQWTGNGQGDGAVWDQLSQVPPRAQRSDPQAWIKEKP